MAVRAQSLLMLLILFPAALCGSAPPEKADATWERFVETAKVLEYSDAKPPERTRGRAKRSKSSNRYGVRFSLPTETERKSG